MFENIKEKMLLKKLEKATNGWELKRILDKYKEQIANNFNAYILFLEKCIKFHDIPREYTNYFQELFYNYYNELEANHSSLLFQMLENKENKKNPFIDIFLNRDFFPSLNKELRLKILSNEFFYIDILDLGFVKIGNSIADLIHTDELVKVYKSNEYLLPLLKERLKNATDEELINYITADENIALYLTQEQVVKIIKDVNLSENIIYELYKENPDIIKLVQNNSNTLLELLKNHSTKISDILSKIDSQNILKIYNLDKEYFNNIFLENPMIFNDNTSLVSYILINHPNILKKLMNLHFYDDSREYSHIFGDDFFLRNRTYSDILTNYGADKFIEFLKLYPLFGASEKSFNPGNQGASVYREQQMFENIHYTLDASDTISIDEINKLIDIDINYLFSTYSYWRSPYDLDQNKDVLKHQIIALLSKRLSNFGLDNKYQKLLSSVDIIFDHLRDEKVLSEQASYQSFEIYKYEVIKLLFNKEIVANNTPEDINNYIESCYLTTEDNQELFYKLFENAYGDKALQIIKSRPGLNPFTINSFEIFRPEIINNFREGFIHDLLSYNIKGFSNFLMISKNDEELNLFIDYYNCLTEIFGENVMTMEKAFMNFYYYKDLVKDVQNVDLSDEEQKNLISVISGNYNNCDINTRKDLIHYNEIANKSLLESLSKAKNEVEYLNIICNDLFGIDYGIIKTSYKFAIDQLSISWNSDLLVDSLEESEKNIMQFLKFICDPDLTIEQLNSFVENITSFNNIRNPKSCASLLNKIRILEIKQVNERLMTDKAIEELISNGSLKKMNDYDGIPIYCYLDGSKSIINGHLLNHVTPLNINQMNNLEPDNGVSTISTWFRPGYNYGERRDHVYFYQIPEDSQIVSSMPRDGQTSKLAKSVNAKGLKGNMEFSHSGIHEKYPLASGIPPEIAFYRRHRDHKNITNENHGGLIVPNCFAYLSLDTIEQAKKCNGIIICSYDNYLKFNETLNNERSGKSL